MYCMGSISHIVGTTSASVLDYFKPHGGEYYLLLSAIQMVAAFSATRWYKQRVNEFKNTEELLLAGDSEFATQVGPVSDKDKDTGIKVYDVDSCKRMTHVRKLGFRASALFGNISCLIVFAKLVSFIFFRGVGFENMDRFQFVSGILMLIGGFCDIFYMHWVSALLGFFASSGSVKLSKSLLALYVLMAILASTAKFDGFSTIKYTVYVLCLSIPSFKLGMKFTIPFNNGARMSNVKISDEDSVEHPLKGIKSTFEVTSTNDASSKRTLRLYAINESPSYTLYNYLYQPRRFTLKTGIISVQVPKDVSVGRPIVVFFTMKDGTWKKLLSQLNDTPKQSAATTEQEHLLTEEHLPSYSWSKEAVKNSIFVSATAFAKHTSTSDV